MQIYYNLVKYSTMPFNKNVAYQTEITINLMKYLLKSDTINAKCSTIHKELSTHCIFESASPYIVTQYIMGEMKNL